jgi:hypothetical protein
MDSIKLLKGSFPHFLRLVFNEVLALPDPDPVQLDIGKFLNAPVPGNKRFIQAFRGVGKSYITCCWVVWKLWRNPYLKFIIASANDEFAKQNLDMIKKIIHAPIGDDLWPELRPHKQQIDNASAFDVGACVDRPARERSVKTLSISGNLASNRGDYMILDDVENSKNSATETMREVLRTRVPEFINMLRPGPDSGIVVLGTPQSMDSIYKEFPAKGYTVRIWTQRYPLLSKLANYQGMLAPMLVKAANDNPALCEPGESSYGGELVVPRFITLAREQELENGAAGYLLQFMLDTELADVDKYPLKARDLICMDVDPAVAPTRLIWSTRDVEEVKDIAPPGFRGDRYYRAFPAPDTPFDSYTGAVMHIDPSGKGKDETTYVVTKFLNGYIFVRKWGGFVGKGYAVETLIALSQIAKAENVAKVVVEENMGSGMFAELLKPHLQKVHPATVEDKHVSGQKELRIIDTLGPVMASHKLVMDLGVIRADAKAEGQRQGMYQLCRIQAKRGALKFDDRLDVLAMGVGHWTEHMAVDEERAETARKQREWDALQKQLGRDFHQPNARPAVSAMRAPGRRR